MPWEAGTATNVRKSPATCSSHPGHVGDHVPAGMVWWTPGRSPESVLSPELPPYFVAQAWPTSAHVLTAHLWGRGADPPRTPVFRTEQYLPYFQLYSPHYLFPLPVPILLPAVSPLSLPTVNSCHTSSCILSIISSHCQHPSYFQLYPLRYLFPLSTPILLELLLTVFSPLSLPTVNSWHTSSCILLHYLFPLSIPILLPAVFSPLSLPTVNSCHTSSCILYYLFPPSQHPTIDRPDLQGVDQAHLAEWWDVITSSQGVGCSANTYQNGCDPFTWGWYSTWLYRRTTSG
jgi:hypothetical protein